MANPENPYADSRQRQPGTYRVGRCSCCDLPFKANPKQEHAHREYCNDCREHYEILGESPERREARLVGDRKRVQAMYEEMRTLLNANENALRGTRDQVASALRSRDAWKRKVDRIQNLHFPRIDGECKCQTKNCPIMKIVGDVDASGVRQFDDDW